MKLSTMNERLAIYRKWLNRVKSEFNEYHNETRVGCNYSLAKGSTYLRQIAIYENEIAKLIKRGAQ